MSKKQAPFCAAQFTATKWASAEEKAKWANTMVSWIQRDFPLNGWTKNLYHHLSNMYGHIAHYNQIGFYGNWFETIHQRLEWLQYIAHKGNFGCLGDPTWTWSDVEQAFSAWVCQSGLIECYQQRCAQDIERRERAQLAALQAKYKE